MGGKKPPFWAGWPNFNELKKTLMTAVPGPSSKDPWVSGGLGGSVVGPGGGLSGRGAGWEGVSWLGSQRVGYLVKQLLGWPTGWPFDLFLGRFCWFCCSAGRAVAPGRPVGSLGVQGLEVLWQGQNEAESPPWGLLPSSLRCPK